MPASDHPESEVHSPPAEQRAETASPTLRETFSGWPLKSAGGKAAARPFFEPQPIQISNPFAFRHNYQEQTRWQANPAPGQLPDDAIYRFPGPTDSSVRSWNQHFCGESCTRMSGQDSATAPAKGNRHKTSSQHPHRLEANHTSRRKTLEFPAKGNPRRSPTGETEKRHKYMPPVTTFAVPAVQ